MRIVAIALVLAILPGIGRADEPAVKQGNPNNAKPGDQANKANPVQELPAELVAAWEKADARVGWMSADQFFLNFREGVEGKKGEVPAFRFRTWTAGVVAKLPQPQTAFGLDFTNAQVTDAGLKELAGLKSLQSLNL